MTAGYVAQLERIANAAHDYLIAGGGSTEPLRRALVALAPAGDTTDEAYRDLVEHGDSDIRNMRPAAGDTIVLTAEEAEKVREALRLGEEAAGIMRSEFPDDRTYAEVEAPFVEALSLLSRGQGT